MVIPWIDTIKNHLAELKIDNSIKIYTKYYKDEPYFQEKLNEINKKLGARGEV